MIYFYKIKDMLYMSTTSNSPHKNVEIVNLIYDRGLTYFYQLIAKHYVDFKNL